MFNSTLKSSYFSKRPKSTENHTLHQFNTIKSSKKYYTPFKSNLTTMHTNNNTLSLYSNHSKLPQKKFFQPCQENSREMNKRSISKSTKNKICCTLKNKVKAKLQKKNSEKISKKTSLSKHKKGISTEKDKIVSNRQLYKGLRQGLNYQSTSVLLSKISQIFDLILQNAKIPYQIQTFLFRPLQVLKNRLQDNGKREIGKTLTEFKNNCMLVFKDSSSSEIALFQRMQLPRNNRWLCSSIKDASAIKKQQETQQRLASFQGLKKKEERCDFGEDEALGRIQNRLDDYLCKSVKYRKVYL